MSETIQALEQEAQNVQTERQRLLTLALHPEVVVRRATRTNPQLVRGTLELIRRVEGRDPSVAPDQLLWLMEFGPYAQQLVAFHPRTLPDTLRQLVAEGHLVAVAQQPAHRPTLELLVQQANRGTLESWLTTPGLPRFLRRLIRQRLPDAPDVSTPAPPPQIDTFNRDLLQARSSATDPDLLAVLAGHEDPLIRQAAVANPATPAHLLAAIRGAELGVAPDEAQQRLLLRSGPYAQRLAQAQAAQAAEAVPQPAPPPAPLDMRLRRGSPDITPEEFASLAVAEPRLQRLAARHLQSPEPLLEKLAAAGFAAEVQANLLARARHPETHPATLRRYARSADWELREAVAANPAISEKLLGQLLTDTDWWVRATAAEHLRAVPEALAALAEEPYHVVIREHVAAHPHTPGASLLALARDAELSVRLAVARNPAASTRALDSLADDPSPRVREAVAAHPMTSGLTVERLLRDPHAPVQALARLRRRDLPNAELAAALSSRRHTVRTVLASHPAADATIWAALATDRHADVRAQIAVQPSLSADIRARLLSDGDPQVTRIALAADPQARPDDLTVLPLHDPRVRLALARNPQAPAALLERLSKDVSPVVRIAVARNPATPKLGLQNLIPDLETRDYLRQHQRFDERLRAQLQAQELNEAADPAASPDTLSRLSTSDFVAVRLEVARHPASAERVLERLAADQAAEVRRALLARPALTSTVQLALAASEEQEELETLLARDDLAEATLERLGRDARQEVRELVARFPRTPTGVLEAMARRAGEDVLILEALCQHPQATAALLEQLTRDPRAVVRALPLRHAALAAPLLTRLLRDQDEQVVRRALEHPEVPPAALAELVTRWPTLRGLVAAHPNTPGSVLERLVADPLYPWAVRLTRRTSFGASDTSWLGRWVYRRAMRDRALLISVIAHPKASPRALTLASRGRDLAVRQALQARSRRVAAERPVHE